VATDGWCSEKFGLQNYPSVDLLIFMDYMYRYGRFTGGGTVAVLENLYPIRKIMF
jgi:hypothetical protein